MATREDQRAGLQRSIEEFAATVRALDDGQFLRESGGRTPRDIVAHLIGWNYHAIDAKDCIERGELPPSLIDPGSDFSRVNGESMVRFDARDRDTLLAQLRDSATAYDAMLATLPEAEWDDNHGLKLGEWAVTNGSFVAIMVGEFAHHGRELADWPAS